MHLDFHCLKNYILQICGKTFGSNTPEKPAATASSASNVATAQSAKPSVATAKPPDNKGSVRTAMIIRPPADQKAMAYSWAYNYDTLLPLPSSDEVFKKKVSCKPPPGAKAK